MLPKNYVNCPCRAYRGDTVFRQSTLGKIFLYFYAGLGGYRNRNISPRFCLKILLTD
nr:MAG TPA: hypothetical protein [Caudoviricetes sp.]